MRAIRRLLVLAVVATAVVIGTAAPAGADGTHRVLATSLTGAEEVPPADPDGVGVAAFVINTSTGRICYVLAVKRIEQATVAHIHKAPAGQNAPPAIDLVAPNRFGFSAACTTVAPAVATDIADNPDQYYVNVHNVPFPGGAIRGQLG
jgi:hypothetical protein